MRCRAQTAQWLRVYSLTNLQYFQIPVSLFPYLSVPRRPEVTPNNKVKKDKSKERRGKTPTDKCCFLIIASDVTQLKSMLPGVEGGIVLSPRQRAIYQANHRISVLVNPREGQKSF